MVKPNIPKHIFRDPFRVGDKLVCSLRKYTKLDQNPIVYPQVQYKVGALG
jgi:hypothetical protein